MEERLAKVETTQVTALRLITRLNDVQLQTLRDINRTLEILKGAQERIDEIEQRQRTFIRRRPVNPKTDKWNCALCGGRYNKCPCIPQ